MADHLDPPGLNPPGTDRRLDITDVYVFQKPSDSSKTILIMNVIPVATTSDAFHPDALYEIRIDTSDPLDGRADITFRVNFSPRVDSTQTATVRRAEGPQAHGRADIGDVLFSGAPVSFTSTEIVTTVGDYKFFAGIRSDPFFFDLTWFLAGLPLPHMPIDDFFDTLNVFGIALEVPNSAIGSSGTIGVWARVLGSGQIDRMGRPAINTVFMKGKQKNDFNRAEPHVDRARFTDNVVEVLTTLGGALGGTSYDATTAATIAGILLPDMNSYDFSSSGFLNGRKLDDDVIDAELALVTNGARTTDGVGAHVDLIGTFPFMGDPHP
jgi:hypothetical protein